MLWECATVLSPSQRSWPSCLVALRLIIRLALSPRCTSYLHLAAAARIFDTTRPGPGLTWHTGQLFLQHYRRVQVCWGLGRRGRAPSSFFGSASFAARGAYQRQLQRPVGRRGRTSKSQAAEGRVALLRTSMLEANLKEQLGYKSLGPSRFCVDHMKVAAY